MFAFLGSGLLRGTLGTCTTTTACAEEFSKIISFGDSLSDVGNVWIATGYTIPSAPYWEGRFSNGPVWVEKLADDLTMTPSVAFLAGGTNFAFGGAETGSGFSPVTGAPNLGLQVQLYLSAMAGKADPDALYTVWAGSNDFLFALGDNPGDEDLAECAATLSTWAGNISTAIAALHGAGATTFLVLNLPGVGNTPRLNSHARKDEINLLIAEFNSTLSANLQTLEALFADLCIYTVDVYGLLNQVLTDPGSYGFTNVTEPAISTPGADPDEYVFWDDIHPTAAAHAMLGTVAAMTIPEPGAVVLLLAGAMVWTIYRWCIFKAPQSQLVFAPF